jgi:hypothetical protein
MLAVSVDLVRRRRDWQSVVVAVIVMLPFAGGMVFWAPHAGHQELQDSGLQQLLSATYVIAGLVLAAALTWVARSDPSPRGIEPRESLPTGGENQAAR